MHLIQDYGSNCRLSFVHASNKDFNSLIFSKSASNWFELFSRRGAEQCMCQYQGECITYTQTVTDTRLTLKKWLSEFPVAIFAFRNLLSQIVLRYSRKVTGHLESGVWLQLYLFLKRVFLKRCNQEFSF